MAREGSIPNDSRVKLAAGLAKIGLVIRHEAWREAGEHGLTPTQAQVMVTVDASPGGRLSVGEIARALAVTQPTVSDAISALERKGLIVRDRSEDDGRVVQVRLTAAGRRETRALASWSDVLLRAIGDLDEHEQGVFVRGLMKMIRSLQQAGRIPTARMCSTCTYFRPHAHPGSATPHHCAYIDAPLRDVDLRLDCDEHETIEPEQAERLWEVFVGGQPAASAQRASRQSHRGHQH